jgi:ornithine cyclodeaminase/alanine dehydrogenase
VIRYLSRGDVEGLGVTGHALADAIEQCVRAAALGRAENVPKSGVLLDDGRLFQSIMAVGHGSPAPPYGATKVIGLSPGNQAKGLPHIGSLIVLLDAETGLPCAVMDGSWITEMRTAALSLVVARRLAQRDSSRIGFVACGAQARSHLAAFREAFPLTSVTAYSRRRETAEAFAAHARSLGLEALATGEPEDAVKDMDIVVTSAPAGSQPLGFLRAEWLKEGAFAALVDLGRSWCDRGFEDIEHRIVDDRAQAEKGSKTRKLTPSGPYSMDIAELLAKSDSVKRAGRERAIFVFQGLALADLAAAALVFDRAAAEQTGTLLPP